MKLISFAYSFLVTSSLLLSSSTPIEQPIQNNVPQPKPIVQEVKKPKVTIGPDVDTIASLIKEKSIEYGVDYVVAMTIIQNESRFYLKPKDGDTHLICKAVKSPYYGQYMRSRGVWQINDCWHPEITDEQAYDLEWSTNWAMAQLKAGNCSQWSTCPL